MALEGSHRDQQRHGEVVQPQQGQHQEQQQGRRLAAWFAGAGLGGGRGGDGLAAGSNISSRGGGAAEGGDSGGEPPLVPLGAITVPPQLIGSPFVNAPVDIDKRRRVPYGWERCLNIKTGRIFYKDSLYWENEDSGDSGDNDDMSRNGKSSKLDLRLNLSAHRGGGSSGGASGSRNNNNNNNNHNNNGNNNGRRSGINNSPTRSSSSSPTSPPSSCVSSDTEQGKSSSPDPAAMVLVGCPHCLMYVMLSEEDPRCPRCKSTVLLDFLHDPKRPPGDPSTRRN